MLVLARLRDETVMIGDEIEVTVVDVRGEKVRLGINAPRSVGVHRKEVYEAIRRENREAAQVQPHDIPKIVTPPIKAPPLMRMAQAEPSEAAAHRPFLDAAMAEARKSLAEGGLPIGAVLVRGHEIIGKGHNRRVQTGNPMSHAEIDAITHAGRQKSYRDTVLYSTLMPCYLCSGAAVQFGIPKVVVGEGVNFPGASEFLRSRGIHVEDLHESACINMMSAFIHDNPNLWHEDIGQG